MVADRLRRIESQVARSRRIHEEGQYCFDVLDQGLGRSKPAGVTLLLQREETRPPYRSAGGSSPHWRTRAESRRSRMGTNRTGAPALRITD
jgi:hypothetical protein